MNTRSPQRRPVAPSARESSAGPVFRPLETIVLIQVGVLLLFTSWAFGGGTSWARTSASAWGSLSLLITFAALISRRRRGENVREPILWLAPFLAFNGLVLLSCLNPSFAVQNFGGQSLLAHTGAAHRWLPSTAHVLTSLDHLWLFDATYLSCFNLLLAIRRRQALRILLLMAVGNAVLLSVFGTFQKLTSDGLFFGLVAAPNPRFFATFVYANHWCAYVILLLAACLGLLFYYARRAQESRFYASILTTGFIGLLLMALTPLLAGSRAGVLLTAGLLSAGLLHILALQRRRSQGRSVAGPAAGLICGLLLIVGAAAYLGQGAVRERWQDTQGQWRTGLMAERFKLYGDTWQLALQQPVFGWGLGSFDKVFQLIRPRPLEADRQYEHSYVDAHSDWLQSLAEVGFAGSFLLALSGLLPLRSLRVSQLLSPLPAYLLAGCGLILVYALVEFPFGNAAVVIAFWICFFGAVQHCRLQSRLPGSASTTRPAFPS